MTSMVASHQRSERLTINRPAVDFIHDHHSRIDTAENVTFVTFLSEECYCTVLLVSLDVVAEECTSTARVTNG
jgi:hypothetical protein